MKLKKGGKKVDQGRWDHGGFEELEREYQWKQKAKGEQRPRHNAKKGRQVRPEYSSQSTRHSCKTTEEEQALVIQIQVSPTKRLSLQLGSLQCLDAQLDSLLAPCHDPVTAVCLKLGVVSRLLQEWPQDSAFLLDLRQRYITSYRLCSP